MNLSKPKINALLALALFTFVFLAAEFRFDINVGLLTGAERVVIAQGFILGASVIGFIGYAPLLGLAQRKGHSLAAVNAAAVPIVIVGLTQIQFPTAPLVLEILGCVGFFGLGLLGAAAHHAFSLAFQDDPKLAWRRSGLCRGHPDTVRHQPAQLRRYRRAYCPWHSDYRHLRPHRRSPKGC